METTEHSRESVCRLLAVALTVAATAAPFLLVTIPPAIDLSQHAAQALLLEDARATSPPLYSVRWWVPYSSGLLVLAGTRSAFGPLLGAKAGLLLGALGWALSLHWLAWRRGRSPAQAALASVFVFNHCLYSGYFSFILGMPAFVVWLLEARKAWDGPFSVRRVVASIVVLAWLWSCHVLWLNMALVLYGVAAIRSLRTTRRAWLRLVPVAPFGVAALWFASSLRGTSFETPPLWLVPPPLRLELSWIRDAVFGGVRGPLEDAALIVVAAWAVVAVLVHRGGLGQAVDRLMLGASGLLMGAALTFPDKLNNTIDFASRWAPSAAALLVLGLPQPVGRSRSRLLHSLVTILVALFSAGTARAWVRFEREELSGLQEVLANLPARPRVLGLSLVSKSEFVRGRPFLQTYAWAQVVRGGELNFSFADFPHLPVVFAKGRRMGWTVDLEWYPETATRDDVACFDFVVLGATETQHAATASRLALAAVTASGRWRLYRPRPGNLNDEAPRCRVPSPAWAGPTP